MKRSAFNTFCKSLPHTAHVVQWGGADVWKVGGPAGKVFAIGWEQPDKLMFVTFKCSAVSYALLKEQEGLRPAPYLASRGMSWMQWMDKRSLDDVGLKTYLKESHRLAALALTKRVRVQLEIW